MSKQSIAFQLQLKKSPTYITFIICSHAAVALLVLWLAVELWHLGLLFAVLVLMVFTLWQYRAEPEGCLRYKHQQWSFVDQQGERNLEFAAPPFVLPYLVILYFQTSALPGKKRWFWRRPWRQQWALPIFYDSADRRGWRHLQRCLRFGDAT